MEPDDPVGDYKVKAKVTDLNAQISFNSVAAMASPQKSEIIVGSGQYRER